jgi:hypothetical protein
LAGVAAAATVQPDAPLVVTVPHGIDLADGTKQAATRAKLPKGGRHVDIQHFRVRIPIRGRSENIELDSRRLPGRVSAAGATDVDPREYDLIGLAMQEPQYGSPGLRELLNAVAKSRVPCMSIMNMPPLPCSTYASRLVPRATNWCQKCAAAAESLSRPASAASALNNGAPNIERADKLVQLAAKQKGMRHPALDAIVALVDRRLEANRKMKPAAA